MGRAEDLFQTLVDGGEARIQELINERVSEELFLDFKRAATTSTHNRLHPDDRDNHAKALSGFGNTAGGVILWGVDCRNIPANGDVARALVPVDQAARFKSWLEADVSGATLPSHVGVQHRVCAQRSDGSGFVVTLIPSADHGPLQAPSQWRYYMRAGSSFAPIPHAILASMFGRRPTPQFNIVCAVVGPLDVADETLTAEATILVRNDGLGIARDLFLAASIQSLGDVPVRIKPVADARLLPICGPAHSRTLVSKPEVVFPPGSEVSMIIVEVEFPANLRGAFSTIHPQEGFRIELAVGCANGPTTHLRVSQSANRLQHTGHVARTNPNGNLIWCARRVFGLVED